MLRIGVTAIALAVLAQGAPASKEGRKVLDQRQFQIGPSPTVVWGGTTPTAIPTSGPGTLPPITGGLNPPKRQETGPVLGGSNPSALKTRITALELEYEQLVQQYGKNPPAPVAQREDDIENELEEYGIAIVQTPDGTSTTITFGKHKRDDVLAGGGGYGTAPFDLTPDPTIPGGVITPDPTIPGGSITPDPTIPGGGINPSTKRRSSGLGVEGLQAALAQLEARYGAYGSGTIPASVFIIMQNTVTILQAEGVTVAGWPDLGGGSTTIGPSN